MIQDVYDIVNCGPRNRFVANDKVVSNCNIQNFKHGHKVGGGLKKAIMSPSADEVIVVADASQIECRLLAWFFDEDWILDAFREGRDVYCEFGPEVYNRTITKKDEQERFVCKQAILSLGYQCGGPKFQFNLLSKSIDQGLDPVRLPTDVCYKIVERYRTKCANIKAGWDIIGQQGIGAMLTGNAWEYKGLTFQEDEVVLPNGLRLRYHGLNADLRHDKEGNEIILNASYDSSSKGRSKLYGGLFTENLIQALARIHVASCMRIIAQTRRVVAMEHDAIGFITKKELGQIDLDWCIKLMSTPPTWAPDVPLAAEGKFDERYPK